MVPPPKRVWKALLVTGRSVEVVSPATMGWPPTPRTKPLGWSVPEPPRYVECVRAAPSEESLETNTSPPPLYVRSYAPLVVG
jgi:hypothetical protein